MPEVIEDGVNDVMVDSWREMPAALDVPTLSPNEQRRTVEERFSPQRMGRDYLAAYQTTSERWGQRARSADSRKLAGQIAGSSLKRQRPSSRR